MNHDTPRNPAALFPGVADDALVDRCLSYLADELDDPAAASLERTLAADPAARRLFAALCVQRRLLSDLHRQPNAQLATRSSQRFAAPRGLTVANPTPRHASLQRGMVYALAASLAIAAALAIYVFAFNSKPETRNSKPAAPAPVATVIDTTGNLVVRDAILSPGDFIRTGDLSLDAGSADLRLTNGVELALRGPTRLTVVGPMHAALTHGLAEFDCPPAATGYTVHLPGGARVVDLGTRFALGVEGDLPMILAVHQGRVEARSDDAVPLTLVAGQGAVGLADPATGAVSFHRAQPMLRFDAVTAAAAARSDGRFTVGSLIEVADAPLWLTHLGVQDAGPQGAAADGFARSEPIPVGLWDAAGQRLLAAVGVTGGATQVGSWRYAPIPGGPVRLEPNTRYRIGALVGGGVEWFLDADQADAFDAGAGVRLIDACFHTGSFAAPTTPGARAPGRWGAANALTVPIPSDPTDPSLPAAERRAQEKNNETFDSQETGP